MTTSGKSIATKRNILIMVGVILIIISLVWGGLKYLAKTTPYQDTSQTAVSENTEDMNDADSNNAEPTEQIGDTAADEASLNDN